MPGSGLVHHLERVLRLGDGGLVPLWRDAAPPEAPGAWGPNARLAREWAGFTLAEVSRASGISPATISRFERERRVSSRQRGGNRGGVASELTWP